MASRRRPRSRKAAPAARRRRRATAIRPRVAVRAYQVRSAAPPLRFGEVTRRAERGRSVIQIRFAIADDVAILLEMIRELAAYERAPHAVLATEEDLRRYGFDHNPRFEALLAFLDNKPAGFALFFPHFSTWRGRPGLYLEDLYVREWARGRGVGRRLMARLAALAIERDWPALHFMVLDWNPAKDFYERLGIERRKEWQPHGASGEALRRLAAQDVSAGD